MKRTMIALALAVATPAMAAPATPTVSATAFVDGIYRPWLAALRRNRDTMYQPPRDGRIYVPEIAALLAKDQRISSRTNEVGEIDWVILCGCQDDAGLGYRVTIAQASATAATARVALSFAGQYSDTLTLKLTMQPKGWRIADVASKDMPSLLALLRNGLRGKK